MAALTADQVKALGRTVLSFAGGVLVGKGVLTSEQLGGIMSAYPMLVDAIGLLLPVIAGLWGVFKASPTQQIQSVQKIVDANGLDVSTKAAIINTTASLPDVRKVVTHDPVLAEVSPSDKVRAA